MGTAETITIEDEHMPPFFTKIPVSIKIGEGVFGLDIIRKAVESVAR